MFGIFSAIGSILGGPITAITGQLFGWLNNKSNVEATEFGAMTAAEQTEVVAYMHQVEALNSAKVANNQSVVAHFMILAFGLPPAIYFGAFWISAGIPALGWHVDPLRGAEGALLMDMGKTIAESFFIYGAAMIGLSTLRSRLS